MVGSISSQNPKPAQVCKRVQRFDSGLLHSLIICWFLEWQHWNGLSQRVNTGQWFAASYRIPILDCSTCFGFRWTSDKHHSWAWPCLFYRILWTGVLFVIALPPYFHLHHHFPLGQNKQPLEHHPIIQRSRQSNISLLTIIPFLKNSISHHPDVDDFFRLFRFHLAPWLWDRHGPQITNSCVSAVVASPSAPLWIYGSRHVLNVFLPTVIVWTKEKGIPMLLTSRSRFAMLCPIFFEEEGIGRWKTSFRNEQHLHDKVRLENSWTLVKCLMQLSSSNHRQVQPQDHPRWEWLKVDLSATGT